MGIGQTNLVSYVLDAVEVIVVASLLLLGWPVATFRALKRGRVSLYKRILAPLGLLPQTCHSILDYHLGRWDIAIAGLEGVVSALEESLTHEPAKRRHKVTVLADIYGMITKIHLRRGFIEDAALVVIRAYRQHGFERFEGIKDFDFKTAQIVKAAVAASELIGEGGVAQVIVESNFPEKKGQLAALPLRTHGKDHAQDEPRGALAEVIPFPGLH